MKCHTFIVAMIASAVAAMALPSAASAGCYGCYAPPRAALLSAAGRAAQYRTSRRP